MKKTVQLFFIVFFLSTIEIYSQCDITETIVVSDMTIIDSGNDGSPDGIINLYDEYTKQTGLTLPVGTWFDPDFNFAIDENSGDLHLWDLENSTVSAEAPSTAILYYKYQLFTDACGADTPAATIQILLAPYSGEADPNIPQFCNNEQGGSFICEPQVPYDLNQTLLATPSAHKNGIWKHIGTNSNFITIVQNKYLVVDIPYEPGPSLVDEDTFDLEYVVPGINNTSVSTKIKVTAVRPVFAGVGSIRGICESDFESGAYDADLNLRDDTYLTNEDIEGVWLFEDDQTGQLTSKGDSTINLKAVYDDLLATNPRFGCRKFDYSYFVESRSNVCVDEYSDVSFVFFEKLRPMTQKANIPEFCVEDSGNTTIDLYDYIDFTTENGVLYDYPGNSCTSWRQVSGPSVVDIASHSGEICEFDPEYTSKGTIDLAEIDDSQAGTYTFEYYVDPNYNCDIDKFESYSNKCPMAITNGNTCQPETVQITIVINPRHYAGENTAGQELCESIYQDANGDNTPVNLINLLAAENGKTIYSGPNGTWVNSNTGATITNPIVLPKVTGQQSFNFEYTTITDKGCDDSASLSFTVHEYFSPGVDTDHNVCSNEASFELLTVLDGNPSNTGFWTTPDGTITNSSSFQFDPLVTAAGVYVYTIPANGICDQRQSELNITVHKNPNAGPDMPTVAYCQADKLIDLVTLLGASADTGGTFVDVDQSNQLSGSVFNFSNVTPGIYNFRYEVDGGQYCTTDTADLSVNVFEKYFAGEDADVTLCSSDQTFDLFTRLQNGAQGEQPDPVGTWTGPKGFTSSTSSFQFDPATFEAGVYEYTVPANGTLCTGDKAELNVVINESPNGGGDQSIVACRSDKTIDLVDELGNSATKGGVFIDVATGQTLSSSVLDITQLAAGVYTYQYQVQATATCPQASADIVLTVQDVPGPLVTSQNFCPELQIQLGDIQVDLSPGNLSGQYNTVWYDANDLSGALLSSEYLSNSKSYMVAYEDGNGCQSPMVAVTSIKVKPLGDSECNTIIPQGVSPGVKPFDKIDLGYLKVLYPGFEFIIYNRYGGAVYKADINTPDFVGESNTGLAISKQLPTGVYFYVFNPQDGVTEPIQGEIFLSR